MVKIPTGMLWAPLWKYSNPGAFHIFSQDVARRIFLSNFEQSQPAKYRIKCPFELLKVDSTPSVPSSRATIWLKFNLRSSAFISDLSLPMFEITEFCVELIFSNSR